MRRAGPGHECAGRLPGCLARKCVAPLEAPSDKQRRDRRLDERGHDDAAQTQGKERPGPAGGRGGGEHEQARALKEHVRARGGEDVSGGEVGGEHLTHAHKRPAARDGDDGDAHGHERAAAPEDEGKHPHEGRGEQIALEHIGKGVGAGGISVSEPRVSRAGKGRRITRRPHADGEQQRIGPVGNATRHGRQRSLPSDPTSRAAKARRACGARTHHGRVREGATCACFPGQGVQGIGMAGDLVTHSAAARVFEEASDALGWDVARMCAEGPAERLDDTAVAQPAIVTVSVAGALVRLAEGESFDCVLGHSLGECSALVIAEVLSIADACRLVAARGRITAEVAAATPGSMCALLGADIADITAWCAQIGDVWAANDNCPGQVVASGRTDAVDALIARARDAGAKARRLAIAGAFHCPLMEDAVAPMRAAIAHAQFRPPTRAVMSATTARWEPDATRWPDIIASQLTHPVRFREAVLAAHADGVARFVDCGPGQVIAGLVRRIVPAPAPAG